MKTREIPVRDKKKNRNIEFLRHVMNLYYLYVNYYYYYYVTRIVHGL